MFKLAVIEEDKCIGCTKCIRACPTDAIIGSENLMHTVISEECIGCKLCISPCPVDCIQLVEPDESYQQKPKSFIVARAKAKKLREKSFISLPSTDHSDTDLDNKKDYIARAIQRAKAKKSNA